MMSKKQWFLVAVIGSMLCGFSFEQNWKFIIGLIGLLLLSIGITRSLLG